MQIDLGPGCACGPSATLCRPSGARNGLDLVSHGSRRGLTFWPPLQGCFSMNYHAPVFFRRIRINMSKLQAAAILAAAEPWHLARRAWRAGSRNLGTSSAGPGGKMRALYGSQDGRRYSAANSLGMHGCDRRVKMASGHCQKASSW